MTSKSPFFVKIPASTSNLGSGFDTVSAGLSLYLEMHIEPISGSSLEWHGDVPPSNIANAALENALEALGGSDGGYRITMHNPIPLKRGLGSSGAAIIGGIRIAEVIAGKKLSHEEILGLALPLEGHPDNLAASLLGGWVISRSTQQGTLCEKIESPLECRFVVAIPEVEISTRQARSILPAAYSLGDVVFNLQGCAMLVHALHTGKVSLLRDATRDRIHQPYRQRLVPGMEDLLERHSLPDRLDQDLASISISGSGSTILAIATGAYEEIGDWMKDRLRQSGVEARVVVLDLAPSGAEVGLLPVSR